MSDLNEYAKTKARLVEDVGYSIIRGTPMQEIDSNSLGSMRGMLPILGCICVHDSPDNPCPCEGPIIWLPIEDIRRYTRSNRRGHDGAQIMEFHVPIDSKVIVEQQIPMSANAYEKSAGTVAKQGKGPPNYAWVAAAFAAGYWIGGKLDDLFGSGEGGNDNVSDDWADILFDNFGPAPDWLQDIF